MKLNKIAPNVEKGKKVILAMESSSEAGTIVWVRRRNGSWWPGRILDTEKLSKKKKGSRPRCATPIQLLGREDASMDWYNLEKSKRIKPFRCGEFDDCIDKAEKSHAVLIKKREKYARREEAILHALELESGQTEKKPVNANSRSSKKHGVQKRDSAAPSECLRNDDHKLGNLRTRSSTKGLDSSIKEKSMASSSYARRGKRGKQSSCEEDKSEAIPRMRGLQDVGLRTAPKRKASASILSEGSGRPIQVGKPVLHNLRSGNRNSGCVGPVVSSKNLCPFKRKRTKGGVIKEYHVKRRDRRRPILQVLKSSAKLPVNHTSQSDGDTSLPTQGEKEQSGVIYRAKRSRCVYLPAESNDNLDRADCPFGEMEKSPSQFGLDNCHPNPGSSTEESTSSESTDEAADSLTRDCLDQEMDEKKVVLPDSTQTLPNEGSNNEYIQRLTESMSSDELHEEAAINGYMSHEQSHDQTSAATELGVSKWQLKGKRNIRQLMKRPMDKSRKQLNRSVYETYMESRGNWSNQIVLGQQGMYYGSKPLDNDYNEDGLIEKHPMDSEVPGFGNRRYPSGGVLKGLDGSHTDYVNSEEDSAWETDGFTDYWDEPGDCFNSYRISCLGNGVGSFLVDVDLKVQTSFQGQHVPLVSLMSRLNGKAIVGHPVQIDALEDGSTDLLFTNDVFSEEATDNDGNTALTPVWRTARRTAMHRVPRPHTTTALNGDEALDSSQDSDPEYKPVYNKSHALYPDQMAVQRSDVCRTTAKKCPKKPIKRAGFSNQKIRKLSSIAIQQKINGKGGSHKVLTRSGLDGLIKPENGATTVTCIPLKLVFSRLLEAVGRPSSRPKNQSVPVNGDTRRKEL